MGLELGHRLCCVTGGSQVWWLWAQGCVAGRRKILTLQGFQPCLRRVMSLSPKHHASPWLLCTAVGTSWQDQAAHSFARAGAGASWLGAGFHFERKVGVKGREHTPPVYRR